MTRIDQLLDQWRAMSPSTWAEHTYGWIMPDKRPIVLLDWQRATLDAWWTHRESVTTLAASNVKKTGKTTLNAILTAWRWLCLPGEHYACGNDLDQSAGRQFSMVAEMVRVHPILKGVVKPTKNQLTLVPTGSTLTALAVDATGNAGANFLTSSHTEAWGILQEAGVRSWEEMTAVPGLFHGLPCLRLADSYAGYTGESQTWHDLVDRGLAGDLVSDEWPIYKAGRMLLFHIEGEEAQRRCFRGTPQEAAVYYDEQRQTLRPATFNRLHWNVRGESESGFVPLEWWQACYDPELRPLPPTKDISLHVGVDAACKVNGDDVGVIACYRHDTGRVAVAWHRVWRGATRRQELRLDKSVEPYLLRQAELYKLERVAYDPRYMTTIAHRLRDAGLNMVEVTQSLPVLGPLGQTLYNLIQDGGLAYYRSDDLKDLTAGAIAREVTSGLHIKKGSGQVDLLVALSFACGELGQRRRPFRWVDVATAGLSEAELEKRRFEREMGLNRPAPGVYRIPGYPANRRGYR